MRREQIAQGQKLAGDFKPLQVSSLAPQQGTAGGSPMADLLAQAGSGDFKPPEIPSFDAQRGRAWRQPTGRPVRAKAEKGGPKAQNELGEALYLGKLGVTRNPAEAVKWFRKAAEQNHPAAQSNLGGRLRTWRRRGQI